LFGNRRKDGFFDNCRDRDGDLMFDRRVVDRGISSRLRRLPALASEARPLRANAGLTEPGLAHVGGILEDAPYRRPIPVVLAFRAGNFTIPEPATHLADRASIECNPDEKLSYNLGLSLVDLVAGLAASFVFPDVTITVGRAAQHVYRPRLRRVPLPPAAAFENLGSLIFGHHPLNLEQQILLGRLADVVVEEGDLHARPLKFIDKKHLIGITT